MTTLDDIAFFLNSITPDTTPAKWKEFLARADKRTGLMGLFAADSLNSSGEAKRVEKLLLPEAKALSAEMASDLTYGTKKPKVLRIRGVNKLVPAPPFAKLLETLNQLELKTEYACIPLRLYGKPRPGQVIIGVGKDRFVPRVYPKVTTPREWLYITLGSVLMDGTLGRLKTCSLDSCGKWIVGKNAGRKFCSLACKDKFNNRRRLKNGYFQKRRQDVRRRRKNEPATRIL